MSEIIVKTTSNGHPVDLRSPLTNEIEQILTRLAIAVAIYVKQVIPEMTTDQIISMIENLKEMLPVEGNWKRCVRLYFDQVGNYVRTASVRLAADEGFKSEDEFYMESTVCGATWLSVATRWRKSRAMSLVQAAGYNSRVIDQLFTTTCFVDVDWWTRIARELRRQGHVEMAEVILADPYRGVIDEEQKLIEAVRKTAREEALI